MIRLAVPSDVSEIARIHVRTWQAAYRGQLPDAYLDALEPAQRIPLWTRAVVDPNAVVLVAAGDALGGFCSLLAARDDDATPSTGELTAIYVDPQCWRAGVGGELMAAAFDSAAQRGFTELTLWVLASNERARRFYEHCGFIDDGRTKVEQRADFTLDTVRYRRALARRVEP